jgi:hypothetical protein
MNKKGPTARGIFKNISDTIPVFPERNAGLIGRTGDSNDIKHLIIPN